MLCLLRGTFWKTQNFYLEVVLLNWLYRQHWSKRVLQLKVLKRYCVVIVSCLCCIPSYRIRNTIVCIYINFWVAQCTGKDLFVFYQLCLNIWSFCFLFVSISGPMKLLLWHLKQFREHWPKIVVWMLLGQWLNSRERWLSLISCKLRVTFHLSIGLGLYGSAWLLIVVGLSIFEQWKDVRSTIFLLTFKMTSRIV